MADSYVCEIAVFAEAVDDCGAHPEELRDLAHRKQRSMF